MRPFMPVMAPPSTRCSRLSREATCARESLWRAGSGRGRCARPAWLVTVQTACGCSASACHYIPALRFPVAPEKLPTRRQHAFLLPPFPETPARTGPALPRPAPPRPAPPRPPCPTPPRLAPARKQNKPPPHPAHGGDGVVALGPQPPHLALVAVPEGQVALALGGRDGHGGLHGARAGCELTMSSS